MTLFERLKRRLAVRLSRTAADDHAAALAAYGLGARKASAAADAVVRAMTNVMVAVLVERNEPGRRPDLLATVTHEISRASHALAGGLRALRALADPDDLHFDRRRRDAALAGKAGLARSLDAAGGLLLACGSPPGDDHAEWMASFVERMRTLLDARTAGLAAALAGARPGEPGAHLAQCLLSVSILDRLAFDLMLGALVSTVDAEDARRRFALEAGRGLAAVDKGLAALSPLRRKLARKADAHARKADDPAAMLDALERAFEVERAIVAVYASLIDTTAPLDAILARGALLQALLAERARLVEARQAGPAGRPVAAAAPRAEPIRVPAEGIEAL